MKKIIALVTMICITSFAQAKGDKTICIFDPVGTTGPIYNLVKDYRQFALEQGGEVKMHAYTDEKIASDDFKAGQCDGVMLTGARARPYSKFASTIEAIGAIQSDAMMKKLVSALKSPGAAKYMRTDRYEVGGVLPGGAVYLFVNDRSIDTVEELSGKKIATLDYDAPSIKMVSHIGASAVPSNSANFSGKFNNGSVDAAYAPALAYKPLEMYKGLANNGGIIRYNIAYLDYQLVLNAKSFDAEFGQKSREYMYTLFDGALSMIEADTAGIEAKYWVDISSETKAAYDEMLRSVRVELKNSGVYDAKMLKLMKKFRCADNPAAAECVDNLE